MRIPGYARADVLTRDDLVTDTGGTMGRVTVRDSVTADGFSLDPRYLAAAVDTARHCRGPALQLG
jgi:hypothetical protein